NESVEGVLELGRAGTVPMALLIVDFFRRGLAAARVDTLGAAIFGGVIAEAVQNFVDFNWHIPANAVTFAALAGLAVQAPLRARRHAQVEAAEPGTEEIGRAHV